ncbi:uncharacterized protein LOC121865012 isoform X2 [Homarus americanus]|uniref:uncharacterized protein LOC121865012 isoform X2 n=1 Tax=Homarus americanus TaxID=6706 RepID=UPI001C43B539|nr:uncharacterized protein LOC121865012 isoform X2 [Homarus americanus]
METMLECMKRKMHHKGWCSGVVLLKAITTLVIWGPVKAAVAYSTQRETSSYAYAYEEKFYSETLESFPELWQRIFLWGFFSLLFIHVVSAIIAFLMLRRHKYGSVCGSVVSWIWRKLV